MPVSFSRSLIVCLGASLAWSQQVPSAAPGAAGPAAKAPDPIAVMVGRLELTRYKATIKGLTQFGDRRQGTDRNRAAVDWIEAQLKSYGCTNTERIHYDYMAPEPGAGRTGAGRTGAGRAAADPSMGPGGSRRRGNVFPDTVNSDPMKQPDVKLRELDSQPSAPGPREEVYCTKIGSKHPDQMYILGAHMDGIGWGEAANDRRVRHRARDGTGAHLQQPDVRTDVSIRFALWNNEETGTNGARAYVDQRKDLQGVESPAGSGKYPEPKWLGMVQHDMMMFDHGMPLKDGTMNKQQRPEADINIEYQVTSKFADAAMAMAHKFQLADDKYATDYPANVGPHMTNTDSGPFMDLTPSLSLREVERGAQMGSGWDPQHHQPTDVYSFYNDDDFRLGLNSAQTTLGAIAQLSGATLSGAK